jgi:hypothetical protein
MAVKSIVFWFVFGISALLAAPGAYAQTKLVKVRCGKQDKNRALYEAPDGLADLAIVKCGSKVQVLGSPEGRLPLVRVKTKDGKEGYLFADAVEPKQAKPKSNRGQAVVRVLSAAAAGAAASGDNETVKLMIFGGTDHKTYLGCLNCSEYATASVTNKYGENGSPYSQTSIWNQYGEYGSHYSSEGACNLYATDPPVVVDQNGKYYGRLSLNIYHPEFGIGARFLDWLRQTVCSE